MDKMAVSHLKIQVTGIVQGVGFRPFVFRLATENRLAGTVLNSVQGVIIHVQGKTHAVDGFLLQLEKNPPPLARVDNVTAERLPVNPEFSGFSIIESDSHAHATVSLSPDMATCPDCLADIRNPESRYYRYPFTNCTNCGPRYTIIRALPYDRSNTAMAGFTMCAVCEREYNDPLNRRYHAQPVSCPDCGPHLRYLTSTGEQTSTHEQALSDAAKAIREGKILAIKGLGGFHLVCDASNSAAVTTLRERKHRPAKPLAVMVKNRESAEQLVTGDNAEWDALESRQRPIVLMRKRNDCDDQIAPEIATGICSLGIFLPYTPLHSLLMDMLENPIVATSANVSGQPIITDSQDIFTQLGDVVDGVLDHNRPIVRACDDSVVQVVDGELMVIRLARGYAPLSIPLESPVLTPLLAVGAQQKSTIAITLGKQVMLSPYIGENQSLEAANHFERTVRTLSEIYDFIPEKVIHDLHQGYVSTQYAGQFNNCEKREIQHHYAHLLAVMAVNNHKGPVLGVAFDGTGLGTDGTLWGGEALLAESVKVTRLAHFAPFKLVGNEQAIKDPTRTLLSLLFERYDPDTIIEMDLPALSSVSPVFIRNLYRLWQSGVSCIQCNSVGRLFDAVARLLNLVRETRFEGEAGMMLESAARDYRQKPGREVANQELVFALPIIEDGAQKIWETQSLFKQILQATQSSPLTDQRIGQIADAFISTLATAVCSLSASCQSEYHPLPVALCGGVFQNRLLLEKCNRELNQRGISQLPRKHLPVNDSGIALGQIWFGLNERPCQTKRPIRGE